MFHTYQVITKMILLGWPQDVDFKAPFGSTEIDFRMLTLRLRLVRLKLISGNQFPENRAFGCVVKFGQTENVFSLTEK